MRFVFRRGVSALLTGAFLALLSFVILDVSREQALPSLAEKDRISVDRARELYGFEDATIDRLRAWVSGAIRGDLGYSWYQSGREVAHILRERLGATILLTATGILLQLFLGLLIGAWTVQKEESRLSAAVHAIVVAVYAIPEVCLGMFLLLIFSGWLGWFPIGGAASASEISDSLIFGLGDRLYHLALPALCLGVGGAAVVVRLAGVGWKRELRSGYVTAAKAKGFTARRILWRSAFPSVLGPLLVAVGLALPALVGGAVIVEQVFEWPGLGRELYRAILRRDLPVIAGVNLLLVFLVTIGRFLADLAAVYVDPRRAQS